jgi:hypothetical protein
MGGLGFLNERFQLSGPGVCSNFLIPKCFAVFQQPISHGMDFLRFESGDGEFDFLNATQLLLISYGGLR